MGQVAENLRRIRGEIAAAARVCGRDPTAITLVGICKAQPLERVLEALDAGLADFGQSYAQELRDVCNELGARGEKVHWHFVGRLQKNKVKYVVGRATMIHSIDSLELAQRVDERAASLNVVPDVLIEVNSGGEASKAGILEIHVPALARAIDGLRHVRLRGLMTLPPPAEDPEDSAPYFVRLRELARRLGADGLFGAEAPLLSMGMSHDYVVAIREGATHIRVGTALFGERVARGAHAE